MNAPRVVSTVGVCSRGERENYPVGQEYARPVPDIPASGNTVLVHPRCGGQSSARSFDFDCVDLR
jgi:hypothetical protein